ncbi:DUF397 domain-containing protein [Streptomyces orinoci]|uniref:DUF397 domain-containing protein n=1 Tax=Streptomyces orinoci TaxID=67339 RepID=A0ABV3JU97_STRON|nr:DUF397 domain-containing protein [Streptomyces orinoci]
MQALTSAVWRKSTHSDPNAEECLEVSDTRPDSVPIRDSKRPSGQTLNPPRASWSAFLRALADNRLAP